MKALFFLFLLSAQLSAGHDCVFSNPPHAFKLDHIDDYHGIKVADPYFWLEDLHSHETRNWIKAERDFTRQAFMLMTDRTNIRARLTELYSFPRHGIPIKVQKRLFFSQNDGLQNQAVLYVKEQGEEEMRALFDPNLESSSGSCALMSWEVSPDSNWLGFGTAEKGTDWIEFRIRNVKTGEDLPERIKWVKFSSLTWTLDNKGFFYGRYPETDDKTFSRLSQYCLYYHRLGSDQSQDTPVFNLPEHPEWFFSSVLSSDGKYLLIFVADNTSSGNCVLYLDLEDPLNPKVTGPVNTALSGFDATYSYIGTKQDIDYFLTNQDAPRCKVISYDRKTQDIQTIIRESQDNISMIQLMGGRFVINYMHDIQSRLVTFSLDGQPLQEITLPDIGSVTAISGDSDDPEMFVKFSSFLHAPKIITYNLDQNKSDDFLQTSINFDPSQYVTKQLFCSSLDGTRIPLFVTHRKDIKLDGQSPLWLYGYGGFNISLLPDFNVPALVWLEQGGIYAQVNLRGGGEYGKEWHLAGTKEHKQNVFDDFISSALWLVKEGYTSHDRLVIHGASNGGLLIAAVINQKPDIAAVALPAVGVMDMLRFHKFTIGASWIADYGSSDDPEGFKTLFAYSPLHNIKSDANYPPVLIVASEEDDRVHPAHSYKYGAAMQEAVRGRCDAGPVFMRIEEGAGHGAHTPLHKRIEDWTDRISFALYYLRKNEKNYHQGEKQ